MRSHFQEKMNSQTSAEKILLLRSATLIYSLEVQLCGIDILMVCYMNITDKFILINNDYQILLIYLILLLSEFFCGFGTFRFRDWECHFQRSFIYYGCTAVVLNEVFYVLQFCIWESATKFSRCTLLNHQTGTCSGTVAVKSSNGCNNYMPTLEISENSPNRESVT